MAVARAPLASTALLAAAAADNEAAFALPSAADALDDAELAAAFTAAMLP